MDTVRLLITDTSFLITHKGKILSQKTFTSDEECFSLLEKDLKPYKKSKLECLFSGSRIISETRTISYTNKDPFLADKHLLDKLLLTAAQSFMEEHKNKGIELVITSIRSIIINGYRVHDVKKRECVSQIDVTVFFGAIPSIFKKNLPEAAFGSFAESVVDKIHKKITAEEFLVCSAYERTTDLSVRKSGNFFKTVTIPLGTHHILEHIQKGLSLKAEESEQHLNLYNEGHADPELAAKIEAAILSFQIALDDQVKTALASLSQGISLPSEIYLLVAPFFRKGYDALFKSESYHSLNFSEKGFEVKNMSSILNP